MRTYKDKVLTVEYYYIVDNTKGDAMHKNVDKAIINDDDLDGFTTYELAMKHLKKYDCPDDFVIIKATQIYEIVDD